MTRDEELELIAECLQLVRDRQPFICADETLVPVAKYLDPERFRAELGLFRQSMNIVGHVSEVPHPGDFITRDLAGTPAIIVRQSDSSLKAFVNVCRHRGARVELRTTGHCRRFVCPYHAWTYDTDGSLALVRHAEGFPGLDVQGTSLVELRCIQAGGLVWVCPDPSANGSDLDASSQTIIGDLDWLGSPASCVFAKEDKVWRANWKLIVDGGLESYHFKIAHRSSIASFFADNISTYRFFGDHIRSVLPRLSIVELLQRPESEWNIREHSHLLYSIAPNASVLVQERHLDLILADPVSIDETRVQILSLAPAPPVDGRSEKERAFLDANHAFTKQTLHEDFALAEHIQAGMASGANEHFRFARFEGALSEWHRRLDERLPT